MHPLSATLRFLRLHPVPDTPHPTAPCRALLHPWVQTSLEEFPGIAGATLYHSILASGGCWV